MTPWNDNATDQDFRAAASECPYISADACAMVQERRFDASGPGWPCREHGGWCEVCEEFRPVIQRARFVDALICEACAAAEPEPEIEEEETR